VGRRRRSRPGAAAPPAGRLPPDEVAEWAGRPYRVRPVTGSAAGKTYRCPGCDQEIRPATPHLVAWPDDEFGGAEGADRRHWHTACWAARDRRAGKPPRARNAPRYG
jgi:hypothetical protein